MLLCAACVRFETGTGLAASKYEKVAETVSGWHSNRNKRDNLYKALSDAIWKACMLLDRHPESGVDFGASTGALLSKLPLIKKRAIDGAREAEAHKAVSDWQYADLNVFADISDALGSDKFDLLICQEVAEHLTSVRPADAPTLDMPLINAFNKCAKPNSVLVFGAGYPTQPGKHHVSCRTARFWQYALETYGWIYEHRATMVYAATFIEKGQPIFARNRHTNCYLNTMVFTRRSEA